MRETDPLPDNFVIYSSFTEGSSLMKRLAVGPRVRPEFGATQGSFEQSRFCIRSLRDRVFSLYEECRAEATRQALRVSYPDRCDIAMYIRDFNEVLEGHTRYSLTHDGKEFGGSLHRWIPSEFRDSTVDEMRVHVVFPFAVYPLVPYAQYAREHAAAQQALHARLMREGRISRV